MRRRMPQPEGVGRLGLDLVVRAHLPGAVVEIHQPIERARLDAARIADLGAGHHATLKPAGVDRHRLPLRRDALGERRSLGKAGWGEREFSPAAKARGLDALDMAVAGEEELGHSQVYQNWCHPERSEGSIAAPAIDPSLRSG